MKARVLLIGLFAAISVACKSAHDEHYVSRANKSADESVLTANRTYLQEKKNIQNRRAKFYSKYRNGNSNAEKGIILNGACEFVFNAVRNDIFPQWFGTPWDFNGTSEVPGHGKIACGYFVSTVLRDAGFKVERYKLAQQTSECIVESLTAEKHIQRYRNTRIETFCQSVRQWGEGLYVVGLDCHVGFIVHDASGVYFVHSSYMDPYVVVKEPVLDSQALRQTEYRVLGKLSEDDELVETWILGRSIETKTQ